MRIATLGEIADWGSGGTPKRGVAEYFGEGTPWLSIADLNDGVVTGAKESLTPAGIANSSAKIVPPGTLFIAMYGSIGKLGLAGSEMTTSQAIAFAKPKEDLVDRRFLFHFLLAERPKLQSIGRGGTQMNIGQADLKAWPIPLPPLPEQRRIAAILDHVDVLRTKRGQVLTHLDALITATFESMFNLQDLPSTPIGVHITEQQVGLVRRGADQGPDRQHDYLKMDAITRDGKLDLTSVTRVDATPAEAARYSVRDGDLLLNTRNSRELVGKTAVYRGAPRLFNNNLMRIRFSDVLLADFVHQYLWTTSGRRQLEARKSGTTSVFAIYGRSLATLLVPIPPLPRQFEFAERVAAVDEMRHSTEQALTLEDELFASLQSRAFRGEL